MAKPKTQTLGVTGIEPMPVNTPDPVPDFGLMITLPPFQMFMVEVGNWSADRASNPSSYAGHSVEQMQALHDQYAAWHTAKGYWPGETPMGAEA